MSGIAHAPPRAVLFDWDTTLVDNWGSIATAMNAALGAMGLPLWTREETIAQATLSARDRFPMLFGARAPEALTIFFQTLERIHRDHLRPLPGASESLETFRGLSLFQAVVSNKNSRFLQAEVDHLQWRGYFGAVIGANDAVRDKPDPAPIALALAGAGLQAGPDIWMIGDTIVDIESAKRAGVTAVFVRTNPHPQVWGDHRPDIEIDDLWQLRRLVIGIVNTI